MRRLVGAVLIAVGTAAFTACLWLISTGMRDVMVVDGGSCGTGGPYVIAHQCSGGDIRLLLVGFFGCPLSAGIWAGGTAALGRRVSAAGLAAFGTGFAFLGWNFIHQYEHPVAGQSGSLGFLIPGILFEVMAVGALIPLIVGIVGDLRSGNRPDNLLARADGPSIVRAVIPAGISPAPQQFGYGGFLPAGLNGSLADAVPQPRTAWPLASLGIWLATSAIGGAIGSLLLSSSLVNLLK
jgi:hypothetical protein